MSRILGVLSILLTISLALAVSNNAANNSTQCASAGGVFTVVDGINYCTVTSEEGGGVVVSEQAIRYNVKNDKGWTVGVETITKTVTVVSKGTGPGEVGTPVVTQVSEVVSCYNPAEKEFENLSHPNCQLPAAE